MASVKKPKHRKKGIRRKLLPLDDVLVGENSAETLTHVKLHSSHASSARSPNKRVTRSKNASTNQRVSLRQAQRILDPQPDLRPQSDMDTSPNIKAPRGSAEKEGEISVQQQEQSDIMTDSGMEDGTGRLIIPMNTNKGRLQSSTSAELVSTTLAHVSSNFNNNNIKKC